MVSTILLYLRLKGFWPKLPLLNLMSLPPGQEIYVLIKAWKEKIQPTWKGPFQVLLTTETVVHS
jgi:hypothetical protein